MLAEFQRRAADLEQLSDTLKAEIASVNRMVKVTDLDDGFKIRTQVRTIFSCIEAYVSHLKQSALLFSLPEEAAFSHAEALALQEQESFVKDDGTIGFRRMKLGLKVNIRLAFSSYARACDREYKIDFGGQGGQDFLKAVKIRDQIMHPKSSASLNLNESDAELAIRAWCWFGEHLVAVSKIDESEQDGAGNPLHAQ